MYFPRSEIRQVQRRSPLARAEECHVVKLNIGLCSRGRHSNPMQGFIGTLEQFLAACSTLGIPSTQIDGSITDKSRRMSQQYVDEKVFSLQDVWDQLGMTTRPGNSRLCVVGAYLDDDVTFFSLEALARGYDTFLLVDLLVPKQSGFSELLFQRLIFSGCVPTTSYQLVTEWATTEMDPSKSAWILRRARPWRSEPAGSG